MKQRQSWKAQDLGGKVGKGLHYAEHVRFVVVDETP
jgi:hypothetical protein